MFSLDPIEYDPEYVKQMESLLFDLERKNICKRYASWIKDVCRRNSTNHVLICVYKQLIPHPLSPIRRIKGKYIAIDDDPINVIYTMSSVEEPIDIVYIDGVIHLPASFEYTPLDDLDKVMDKELIRQDMVKLEENRVRMENLREVMPWW